MVHTRTATAMSLPDRLARIAREDRKYLEKNDNFPVY